MYQSSFVRLFSLVAVVALSVLLLPEVSAQSLVTAKNLSNGTMYSDQVARQAGDFDYDSSERKHFR